MRRIVLLVNTAICSPRVFRVYLDHATGTQPDMAAQVDCIDMAVSFQPLPTAVYSYITGCAIYTTGEWHSSQVVHITI